MSESKALRSERANLKRLERERARVAKLIERLEKLANGKSTPKPSQRSVTKAAIVDLLSDLKSTAYQKGLDEEFIVKQIARYAEKPRAEKPENLLDVTRRMELESARKVASEIESAIDTAKARIATAEKAVA